MMCDREPLAVKAQLSGQWPGELKAHVAQCAGCQEAVLLTGYLHAAGAQQRVDTPAAGMVWFKAQLRLRREARERAERPLVWGQRAVLLMAGAGMAWAAGWAMGTSASLAAALIGSCVVLSLTAGGVLLASRERK